MKKSKFLYYFSAIVGLAALLSGAWLFGMQHYDAAACLIAYATLMRVTEYRNAPDA